MEQPLQIGAVIYDPKVTVIWDLIEAFYRDHGMQIESKFYKNYSLQVDALMEGEIDIAWNSPLAWLDTYLRSNGKSLNGPMRDTDQDRKTMLIVRKSDAITSLEDLKGKIIGFGAEDSPQARLIPINFLSHQGLEWQKDYQEKRFDVGVGLHGDHVGGELDAVLALEQGKVDAAFTLDLNWNAWIKDGTVDTSQLEVLETTPLFDHCIFSTRVGLEESRLQAWSNILLQMTYEDQQEIMDMEGLKKWVPGRTTGYEQIQQVNQTLRFFNR